MYSPALSSGSPSLPRPPFRRDPHRGVKPCACGSHAVFCHTRSVSSSTAYLCNVRWCDLSGAYLSRTLRFFARRRIGGNAHVNSEYPSGSRCTDPPCVENVVYTSECCRARSRSRSRGYLRVTCHLAFDV